MPVSSGTIRKKLSEDSWIISRCKSTTHGLSAHSMRICTNLVQKGDPRLCRGGTQSLTVTEVSRAFPRKESWPAGERLLFPKAVLGVEILGLAGKQTQRGRSNFLYKGAEYASQD